MSIKQIWYAATEVEVTLAVVLSSAYYYYHLINYETYTTILLTLVCIFKSAPSSIKYLTISEWPWNDAYTNAVYPLYRTK